MALTLAAIACGAIVGVEREKKIKPAGLRTMILIALGSALFTMLSGLLTDDVQDKSRVAAQIVSGIGFLGAGAILHDSVRIRGLTTAAMIWFMAAIGMLCGAGYGGIAIVLTVVLSLLLQIITRIENRYLGPCFHTQVTLLFDDRDGKTSVRVDSILEEYRIMTGAFTKSLTDNGLTEMTVRYCSAHKHHKSFLLKFADMPEIKNIQRE
ncbi:MAG: MgtC/SapB family protein [Methylobacter sp.]|uniref:MgtC/SapB family protein n=1 Tax=Methylobacter sp. TaxID=2051955 RepID=UPI00258AC2E8|nr:MgtC/SapB family protein [Methylobacter sp.]MCL7419745.1 MgtC/SapB family protein [Methylobacter sp.]